MARTIVYPGAPDLGKRGPDGFASKLAKYVPVEMITIATTFFALFSVRGVWIWVMIAVGAVLNAFYLFTLGRQPDVPTPPQYFYLLSMAAFVLWSVATIDTVAISVGLSGSTEAGQRAFILGFAALFVPALDMAFSANAWSALFSSFRPSRRRERARPENDPQ